MKRGSVIQEELVIPLLQLGIGPNVFHERKKIIKCGLKVTSWDKKFKYIRHYSYVSSFLWQLFDGTLKAFIFWCLAFVFM